MDGGDRRHGHGCLRKPDAHCASKQPDDNPPRTNADVRDTTTNVHLCPVQSLTRTCCDGSASPATHIWPGTCKHVPRRDCVPCRSHACNPKPPPGNLRRLRICACTRRCLCRCHRPHTSVLFGIPQCAGKPFPGSLAPSRTRHQSRRRASLRFPRRVHCVQQHVSPLATPFISRHTHLLLQGPHCQNQRWFRGACWRTAARAMSANGGKQNRVTHLQQALSKGGATQ